MEVQDPRFLYSLTSVKYGECDISREIAQNLGEQDEYVLSRSGIQIPISGDARRYISSVFSCVEQVLAGKEIERTLARKLRKLDKTAVRSQIFTPTETFRFRAITWTTMKVEGKKIPIFNHNEYRSGNTPPDLVECAEPSRHRPINSLDPEKIKTYRLDTAEYDAEVLRQIFGTIRARLEDKTGKPWVVLGNHNEYVVFTEIGYAEEVFEKVLSPEVNNILRQDIKRMKLKLAPIQKPTLGSKIVTISLLSAGEHDRISDEELDLSDYPVYDEDSKIGNNDGTFLVLRAPDFWRLVKAHGRNMPLTSGIQCRIPSIVAKGMIALEQPWLPAGWYTKGLTILEADDYGTNRCHIQYYVPEKIKISDILILDVTSAHNGARSVSISSQMAAYADKEFREWWECEAVEAINNLLNGQQETWSHVYNAIAHSNPWALMEVGAWGDLTDSLIYRVFEQEALGSNWRYVRDEEDGPQNKKLRARNEVNEFGEVVAAIRDREVRPIMGAEERGIIRALPVPGEYTITMGTSLLNSEPDEDGDYQIIISSATAHNLKIDGRKIQIGDRVHIWRCPILPHEGVALSCKIQNIWTARKWLRWLREEDLATMTAEGFDPENPSHIQIGHVAFIAPNVMDALDGDFDGDRIMITAAIVERFEKQREKEWRPPFIVPKNTPSMCPTKIPENYSWLKPADRENLAALSQGRISDWGARRWADIFDNPPVRPDEKAQVIVELPNMELDVYSIAEMNQEERDKLRKMIMDMCVKIIRGQVQGKKHPVTLEGAEMAVPPKGTYGVDIARALEAELCANKGPFVIHENGSYIIHPKIQKLWKDLNKVESGTKKIFAAIFEKFNYLLEIFQRDPYQMYQITKDGTCLSDSKIAFNGNFQRKLRMERWSKLTRTLSIEQIVEITGGESVWIDEKMIFRNPVTKKRIPGETPFVPRIAAKILQARMGEAEIGGKKISCFWNDNVDGTFTLTTMNGKKWIVSREEVKFVKLQRDRERIAQANSWIKNAISHEAKAFAERHQISLPTDLSEIYEDTETWITTVFEAGVLLYLSKIDLATPGTGEKHYNYWSYAADVVSLSALQEMMGGPAEKLEMPNGQIAHRCYSNLDAIVERVV